MKRAVLAGAIPLAFAACADPSAPTQNTMSLDDIATAMAVDGTLQSAGAAPAFGMGMVMLPPLPGSDCKLSGGDGTPHPCPGGPPPPAPGGPGGPGGPGAFGVTVTHSETFRDASGNVQSAYDSTTTASIDFALTVNSPDTGAHIVHDTRNLTASGLLGTDGLVTWNGNGTSSESVDPSALPPMPPPPGGGPAPAGAGEHHGGGGGGGGEGRGGHGRPMPPPDVARIESSGNFTVADLRVPRRPAPGTWPAGGTVTQHQSVKITKKSGEVVTMTHDVSITFDGTQYATVTIDGKTQTVDLAARARGPGGHEGHRGGGPPPPRP